MFLLAIKFIVSHVFPRHSFSFCVFFPGFSKNTHINVLKELWAIQSSWTSYCVSHSLWYQKRSYCKVLTCSCSPYFYSYASILTLDIIRCIFQFCFKTKKMIFFFFKYVRQCIFIRSSWDLDWYFVLSISWAMHLTKIREHHHHSEQQNNHMDYYTKLVARNLCGILAGDLTFEKKRCVLYCLFCAWILNFICHLEKLGNYPLI